MTTKGYWQGSAWSRWSPHEEQLREEAYRGCGLTDDELFERLKLRMRAARLFGEALARVRMRPGHAP